MLVISSTPTKTVRLDLPVHFRLRPSAKNTIITGIVRIQIEIVRGSDK
jgi:hypothetical protein